jgi:hypothetical protein
MGVNAVLPRNALPTQEVAKIAEFLYSAKLWHVLRPLMVNVILMSPMREMMARLVNV